MIQCHKYESVGCNVYTVKNLLESNENLQIRLIGKNLGGGGETEKKKELELLKNQIQRSI